MALKSFSELFDIADNLDSPVAVAAAGGADTTVIQALELARRRGWVDPILTGDPDQIAEKAHALEIDLSPFTILEDDVHSARIAGRASPCRQGGIPDEGADSNSCTHAGRS